MVRFQILGRLVFFAGFGEGVGDSEAFLGLTVAADCNWTSLRFLLFATPCADSDLACLGCFVTSFSFRPPPGRIWRFTVRSDPSGKVTFRSLTAGGFGRLPLLGHLVLSCRSNRAGSDEVTFCDSADVFKWPYLFCAFSALYRSIRFWLGR